MLPSLLLATLLFGVITFGLGWPFVARLPLTAPEKIVASAAVSVLGVFTGSWAVFVFALPVRVFWPLPAMAVLGLMIRRKELGATASEPSARTLFGAHAAVTFFCLCWLATLVTYSGGGWAGDWYEHWERTRFFVERWPLDTKFIGQYALTARPPLVNVSTALFLALTRADFAHFQIFSTLLACLAFLPAALLAVRWGGLRAVWVLAALVMVNPLFVQNATFAWTKLPTAFFVLTAIYFFLRAHDAEAPSAAVPLGAACLAAGALAHYSAGPYFVMLAAGWLALGWRRRWERGWWRNTALAALTIVVISAMWFGWAIAIYGIRGTFLTNTSVTSEHVRHGSQLLKIALNIFDTIVPHFLRSPDRSLIAQQSPWGTLRDWFFLCYQLNLLLAFGCVAWLVLGRELARAASAAPRRDRASGGIFIAGVVLLGIAVHGARDSWGLAHICLQPLVVLGLAFLAARAPGMGRRWQLALLMGAVFDFVVGILLHFGVESLVLEHWFAPGRTLSETFATLSEPAKMNLGAKVTHRLLFVADELAVPVGLPLAMAGTLLVLAAIRVARIRRT